MAVVAPRPSHDQLDHWGSGTRGNKTSQVLEPMTSIMSYQYPPPPPPNGAEMDGLPPSGYMAGYGVPPPPGSIDMRPGQDSSMSLKERKDSLSQASSSDHQMGMSSEKRRNKLGYHRTSVACGHCRRRKIRCIPSPADVQGRCVNCIRLKKECSFYPVEQQPTTDSRSKTSSRASTGPKMASASSSPALPSGLPSEHHQPQSQPQQQYPPLTMPSMAPPPIKSGAGETFSPDGKIPSSASSTGGRPFDFANQPLQNWMSADQSPSSATKPNDLNTTWRQYPHESPITPSFSPYTPHAPPSAGWNAPASGEHTPREEVGWSNYPPPPPRSMSYGGESMSSHTSGQYPPMSNRPYERKSASISSDVYPPPIATTVAPVETPPSATAMEHSVSLSAGAVPSSNYGTWQQQPYSSYPKPTEPYGSWTYGENGSNPSVQPADGNAPPEPPQPPSSDMYYPPR